MILEWQKIEGLEHCIPHKYPHLRLRIHTAGKTGQEGHLYMFHPEKGWECLCSIYQEISQFEKNESVANIKDNKERHRKISTMVSDALHLRLKRYAEFLYA